MDIGMTIMREMNTCVYRSADDAKDCFCTETY